MAFALNLLALLMVIGLCWAAMMWLSGRSHGHGRSSIVTIDDFDSDNVQFVDTGANAMAPCGTCDGVGASHRRGRLQPCPQCEGTGILR